MFLGHSNCNKRGREDFKLKFGANGSIFIALIPLRKRVRNENVGTSQPGSLALATVDADSVMATLRLCLPPYMFAILKEISSQTTVSLGVDEDVISSVIVFAEDQNSGRHNSRNQNS